MKKVTVVLYLRMRTVDVAGNERGLTGGKLIMISHCSVLSYACGLQALPLLGKVKTSHGESTMWLNT